MILPIMSMCLAGLLVPAHAQNGGSEPPDNGGGPPMQAPSPDEPGAPADSGAPGASDQTGQTGPGPRRAPLPAGAIHFVQPGSAAAASLSQVPGQSTTMHASSVFMPPDDAGGAANPDQLRLNFNNVPLDMVLNYLSDAAGFIIVMNTSVHGNVSVISSHPMTRDEAVNLLNAVLNQNGYAAVRNGRTLTIMEKSAAKNSDIPVQIGNNPAGIPRNDEIVTQIIPVRYVDASQLVSDLSSFVSPEATIVANQAGNSIVVTDTQQNIHHLVEIIAAIDQSAAGETEIQVFPLKYANPNDVATELGEIFPSGNPTSTGGSPIRFGGFGGGGFFGRMMAAAQANNSGNGNRAQKQSQVTAVADARTQSVIVMASKDLMVEITGMMQSLDVASTRDQGVYAFHLHNADPQEVAQVLQSMFQSGSSGRGSAQNSSQQPETSARMNRVAQNAQTVSTTSSTISSGTGTGVGRGGGGGGGLGAP
ncbi:MAG TPA: secretin N-terminal domain-containing protein [Verrucomicrobiae bacterium]|nr:secretin N-terminal domain-containing protein [Verrucomicrobiae bacterium]